MRVSKFIPAVLFVMLPVFNAFAIETTPMCPIRVQEQLLTGEYVYDESCYDTGTFTSACYDCGIATNTFSGVTTTSVSGVKAIQTPTGTNSYGETIYSISCSCTPISQTYVCAAGYYGTAISARSGCLLCPDNATCAGGNGSTFVCNSGYVKTDTGCTKCADGEWMNGTVCEPCPTISDQDPNSSSNAVPHTPDGATSITQCYYLQTSLITDVRGTYYFNNDCNYGVAE